MQTQIGLSASQQAAMATARVNLLQRMAVIRRERQSTFTAVSMALLQQSQVQYTVLSALEGPT